MSFFEHLYHAYIYITVESHLKISTKIQDCCFQQQCHVWCKTPNERTANIKIELVDFFFQKYKTYILARGERSYFS